VHELIDTEDFDADEELYWPDDYKQIIRQGLPPLVQTTFRQEQTFINIYQRSYQCQFDMYDDFTGWLADMTAIGAENGTDDMFLELHAAMVADAPLPKKRSYARSLLPGFFHSDLQEKIKKALIEEYAQQRAYGHAFDHYDGEYVDFGAFMDDVAELILAGAKKGSEDMLQSIYRSLFLGLPLPPARRRPKRLKKW